MPPRSKIALLPPEIRTWLHKALVARGYGDIVALTEELNKLCKEGGVAITIGKSAVGVESQRVQRAQQAIAATTQAMQLIADTATDEADKRGEALNAMVSKGVFDVLMDVQEAGAEEDPAARMQLLNKAALAAGRLTTTSVRQRQWRHEVETRAQAAADKVTKLAKKGGMDAKTVAEIRASILGVVKREAPTAP